MNSVLPTFLILGAEKSGTTALDRYLRQHPDILMSNPKETFYFTEEYERGVEWLSSHFEEYEGETAIGEGTATTMYHPKAPERVENTLGAPRLVFLLRDPVERAYSQYFFYIHKGKISPNRPFVKSIQYDEYGIVKKGEYKKYISRFANRFGKENIKVILSKNLKESPEEIVTDISGFLGAEGNCKLNTQERHNVTLYPKSRVLYALVRSSWHTVREGVESIFPTITKKIRRQARRILFDEKKPPMSDEARSYLQEHYAAPNAKLAEYLGRDLSHWT